jgi:tRNA U34 2-thiouridine synthase MnmA/TrmU
MDYQNASTVVDKILALPKDRKNLVAITLWTWWSARNNINAGEKLKTTEEICHSIVIHHYEFNTEPQQPTDTMQIQIKL